ncbi:MAG: magnesium chelatase subunit D [Myxococcota bacterium]
MSGAAGGEPFGLRAGEDASGWPRVQRALALFAIDPVGLGGLWIRSGPDPRREAVVAWAKGLVGDVPWLRLPSHVTEDRLLGGLALAETLERGRMIHERGLLARADGGVVVAPMAERLEANVVAALGAALDRGELVVEREGLAARVHCRLGLIALDEGREDEAMPAPLRDRLAFPLDLAAPDLRGPRPPAPEGVADARARLADVAVSGAAVEALVKGALALDIPSLRAAILAARAARANAALGGRAEVVAEDLEMAARLVLGPRAQHVPETAEEEPPEDETPEEEMPEERPNDPSPSSEEPPEDGPAPEALDDVVLEAAASAIPAGLLDALRSGSTRSAATSGQAGALGKSDAGGRPAGTLAMTPRPGQRLNVVETLRAAAPWQKLRRRGEGPVQVRKSDFRVTRFRQKTETRVIFCVDASGSAALRRLAEAKGAVERVLADCYVRRDHVAMLAFRGSGAELVLPPTRSLTRARRELAGMAGGGTTPIAAGLDAARALALDARRRGQTPLVVVMTDGRANVARDGRPDPAAAREDALTSARALRSEGIACLFLDTAPRPRPRGRALAEALGARYLPLPYLDAAGVSREVQGLARAGVA